MTLKIKGVQVKESIMLKKEQILIAPSIFGGDFGRLGDEAKRAEDAGADRLHIDIMDGHFVKNLTLGPRAAEAIRRSCNLFLEVHLMMYNPFDYVEAFAKAGANLITFHLEATEDIDETIDFIRKCNMQVGLAICPETSATLLLKYLEKVDLILAMTVNPGFGGQKFIPEVLEKVAFLRDTCNQLRIGAHGKVFPADATFDPLDIEVDGGVIPETAAQCIQAGANVLVAGSYLYKHPQMKDGIQTLKGVS